MMFRRCTTCRCVRISPIAPTNWTRLALLSHVWWWGMNFWVRLGNQTPKQSMALSKVSGTEKSQTVKVKSQNHVDHVLRCERASSTASSCHRVDDYSASLQGDPATYASISLWEGSNDMVGQILAASPRQYTSSERPEHKAISAERKYILEQLSYLPVLG